MRSATHSTNQGPVTSHLIEAFGIAHSAGVVALVGAGGKTSLMYALAHEIQGRGQTVITTTTTKIRPPNPEQSPCLILTDQDPGRDQLRALLKQWGHVTLAGSVLSMDKLQGVSAEIVGLCSKLARWVLVEADGASGKPIKAPEQWEPVVPSLATLVVPVVGLDCVSQPATEDTVFRLERFLDVTGSIRGDVITPRMIADLLCHSRGALKGVPESAEVLPFLNKTDCLAAQQPLRAIHSFLVKSGCTRIRRIIAGKLKDAVEATTLVL
jgi:probable selenium-dependent hydroxylase accessory protein YqeC